MSLSAHWLGLAAMDQALQAPAPETGRVIPLVYGRARVACPVVERDGNYLYFVIGYEPIEAVELTTASIGQNLVTIELVSGPLPSGIEPANILFGRVEWPENVSEVMVTVYGRKVRRVADAATIIASGGSYWDATRVYSANPLDIICDLLFDKVVGAGRRFDPSWIADWDRLAEDAAYCDHEVPTGRDDPATEPRYTLSLVIDRETDVVSLIQRLLPSFAGFFYVQGRKIYLGVKRAEAPKLLLNETNIVKGSFQLTGQPQASRPGRLRATFRDGEAIDFPQVTISVESDLGGDQEAQVELYTASATQAVRLALIHLAQLNYCREFLRFKVGLEGELLVPGDVILVHHSMLGAGAAYRTKQVNGTRLDLYLPLTLDDTRTYGVKLRQPESTNIIYAHVVSFGDDYLEVDKELTVAPETGWSFWLFEYLARGAVVSVSGDIVELDQDITPAQGDILELVVSPDYRGHEFLVVEKVDVATYRVSPSAEVLEGKVLTWYWKTSREAVLARVQKVQGSFDEASYLIEALSENFSCYSDDAKFMLTPAAQAGTPAPLSLSAAVTYIKEGLTANIDFSWAETDTSWPLERYDLVIIERQSGDIWQRVAALWPLADGYTLANVDAGAYVFRAVGRVGSQEVAGDPITVEVDFPTQEAPPTDVTGFTYSLEGPDLVLTWDQAQDPYFGTEDIAGYEIRVGADWDSGVFLARVDATEFRKKVDWSGTRRFLIKAIDRDGFYSENATALDVIIDAPPAPTLKAEVIDNNVFLRWERVTSTLPVDHYEVRRGPAGTAFADAQVVDRLDGTFSVVYEPYAGEFVYYVAAVDSAGNVGATSQVSAKINEPPDYILRASWDDDFSGTKVNCILYSGKLFVCVPPGRIMDDHWDPYGGTPQAKIDAGYPIFIQPSTADPSYYEQTFDYGTVLGSTKVTVSWQLEEVTPAISVSCDISVSEDGLTWNTYTGVSEIFATNFRYVKVRLNFTASDDKAVGALTALNVRLSMRRRYDYGRAYAYAADASGTWVDFNVDFVDVDSIVVTPEGTTSVKAVYDFDDQPYPAGFSVYLFDDNGNRVDGWFSWQAAGY